MNDERIHLTALGSGHSMFRSGARYYANVQGVHPRQSIGVYFDETGSVVVAFSIYDGKKAQEMISKLHSEIARRGVALPEEVL